MFIQNKYSKWYFNIVNKAMKFKPDDCYTECHHIHPRSLGGTNDLSNLVYLTGREHFICHRLLIKMTTGKAKSKMVLALRMMMNISPTHKRYTKLTAKEFESYRVEVSKATSIFKSGVKLSAKACANIKASRTPEVCAKISAAQKGRVFPGDRQKLSESVSKTMTQEHRKLLSEKAKQRPPITDETRAKMRASKKPMSQETIDKLTKVNQERILSDEARAKLSAANKGKKRSLTPEQRQKISDAARIKRELKQQLEITA